MKIFGLAFLVSTILACFSPCNGAKSTQETRYEGQDVALVRTAEVKMRIIRNELTAYGKIIPAPGSTRTLAIPFESQVNRIFVTEGQQVTKGEPLLEISPTPATVLMVETAQNRLKAARLQLEKVKERVRMKLAHARELIQAEKDYNRALLRMENLKKMKISKKITIFSKDTEMIVKLCSRAGRIIPSGSALMEIVDGNMVEAVVGIEPEDSHLVKIGQVAILTPINREKASETKGKIRTVSQAVNTSSRLIDTFIQVPEDSSFLVNEFVKARIVLGKKRAMVVPRSAVLPTETGPVLFTVENGVARRHVVRTGWEDRNYVEISSSSIKPGDEVIVTGNYEVRDGMTVRVAPGAGPIGTSPQEARIES